MAAQAVFGYIVADKADRTAGGVAIRTEADKDHHHAVRISRVDMQPDMTDRANALDVRRPYSMHLAVPDGAASFLELAAEVEDEETVTVNASVKQNDQYVRKKGLH